MNLVEYQSFVVDHAPLSASVDTKDAMGLAALGLTGEAGEFADHCKKLLFHGISQTAARRQDMIHELGDILWYLTFAAINVCGSSLQEVLDANVGKLQKRFASGHFTTAEVLAKEALKYV
jgi:NTP pyrophosphatase (non-canonical NTP hydrolase)